MEGGCPANCLCIACLPFRMQSLLEAPASVQRAALRALAESQAADVGNVDSRLSRGSPTPGPLRRTLIDELYEQHRSSTGSPTLPSTSYSLHGPGSPTMGHTASLLMSVEAFMPAVQQPISAAVPMLEPLPQPQFQPPNFIPGIPPSLVTDAYRIHGQIPFWLRDYANFLTPGLDHVIRNLADAGPYKRSGMLEGLSMIIETYTKYYEEFNKPHGAPPKPPNLDHLLVEGYVQNREEDNCTLCYETLEEGDEIIWTPCRHFFHNECFKLMVKADPKRRRCPLCRGEFAKEEEEVEEEEE